jgi:hypothetical protein
MLTEQQCADFERDGILKLENVFPEDAASAMRGVFWREMDNRYGVKRDDRDTWDLHRPDGLKSTKKSRAFDPILSPMLRGALDGLFGEGGWQEPRHMGQVLVTMPNAAEWRVPHKLWHSDFEATHTGRPLFALKWWTFFDVVEPGQGGTPQLAGSHNLFARYLATCEDREYKHARDTFLKSHDWLRALTKDDGSADRNDRFMTESDIDGLPARVVELTGKPGDVFLTHPWVFHSIAVNARSQPRLMRSAAVRAA